jgi:hypothetical protein
LQTKIEWGYPEKIRRENEVILTGKALFNNNLNDRLKFNTGRKNNTMDKVNEIERPKKNRRCSGIKDFRNAAIYEGDILKPDNIHECPFIVKYENGDFYLYSVFGKWGLLSKMPARCKKLNIKMTITGSDYD